MTTRKFLQTLIILMPMLSASGYAQQQEVDTWQSANGLYSVMVKSDLNPITINQIHSWTLQLTDAQGQDVTGAGITVKGGMPEHNHGLATAPSISSQGNGSYQLQGLRFHMPGYWELTLVITHEDVTDTVLITLNL